MTKLKVGRFTVELTNQDRVLFGRSKITKGDLVQYYQAIAPTMLPYLKDRPISMQRFPNGITQEGFYQKDAADYFPDYVERAVIPKEKGVVHYVVCNNAATIVYLANLACITIHAWLSKTDKLDYPDRIIFDLDPSGKDFNQVRHAALQLRSLLQDLDVHPFVMTTGSRGLHVVVPIKRAHPFDFVRTFARDVAQVAVAQDPQYLTLELNKKKRGKKIFIDYLRNGFGATGVAPYAVRPKEKAPVAMPIPWKEVQDAKLSSQRYTIANVMPTLKKRGDVWKDMMQYTSTLTKSRKKLNKLLKQLNLVSE